LVRGITAKRYKALVLLSTFAAPKHSILDEENLKFNLRQVESYFSYFNFKLIIYHKRLPTHSLFLLRQINLLDLRLGHGNTGCTSGM
jgi:hypothetical protein